MGADIGEVASGGGTGDPPSPLVGMASPGGENANQKSNRGRKNKLSLILLIFIIFFEVSGGPYGEEPAVQAAGPLMAIIGFLVFPFIWSIPEALVTAELATAYPGNGGYVVWITEAFGPFPGSMMDNWKYLSGVINNAAYPVLCSDYLSRISPRFGTGGGWRQGSIIAFTVGLSFLNYTGVAVVGWAAVALGAVALPKIQPRMWLKRPKERMERSDWSLYFNTLFWNLRFWDNVSTMTGEVERPQRTFPGYLLPLFAATGTLDVPQEDWSDGYLADAAGMIVGRWLKIWVEVGAVLSAVGLYEAQLSTCAFQLLGMADLGLLPRVLAVRSTWFGTPWLAILGSTAVTLAVSFMSFNDIIASANFLYGLSMLLEFAAFIWLRRRRPLLKRPFRVPMKLPALTVMCLVPSGFLFFVMIIGSWPIYAISAGLTALGVAVYYGMGIIKARGWMEFSKVESHQGEDEEGANRGKGSVAGRCDKISCNLDG
ncbi:unnamed protein product [Spirodela intermedia]|uniref:Polyamine transporter PUT1 n=1 Tax=Spirodela intermedia TaxID=51605 RepID=A0A7I8IXY5_SPIIN|nr:unnamed protein product [Spirodela intermedia]CAA6662865.1 unnamed protein product [Spirodela intermedia]